MNDRVISFLTEQEPEMFRFLERLVLINSHTGNKTGVDKVGRLLTDAINGLGFRVSYRMQKDIGNIIIAKNPVGGDRGGRILLSGHMDTVFPPGDGFDYFRCDKIRSFGPGVIDMKGGLVVMVYALKALHHDGLLNEIPVTVVFNSDEETGAIRSSTFLTR